VVLMYTQLGRPMVSTGVVGRVVKLLDKIANAGKTGRLEFRLRINRPFPAKEPGGVSICLLPGRRVVAIWSVGVFLHCQTRGNSHGRSQPER
jgi:hypothetical protein